MTDIAPEIVEKARGAYLFCKAWLDEDPIKEALLAVLPDIRKAERERCKKAVNDTADAARADCDWPTLADKAAAEAFDDAISAIRALEDK